jgi:hypothetical protein
MELPVSQAGQTPKPVVNKLRAFTVLSECVLKDALPTECERVIYQKHTSKGSHEAPAAKGTKEKA